MAAKELQELGQWKVGQRVVLHAKPDTLSFIDRITDGRGGTIYIGVYKFDISGHQRTSDVWHPMSITPATDEDIKRIKGDIAKTWLRWFDWSIMPGEKAIQIENFMKTLGINIRQKKT